MHKFVKAHSGLITNNDSFFQTIFILRMLLLSEANSLEWERIDRLMDHREERLKGIYLKLILKLFSVETGNDLYWLLRCCLFLLFASNSILLSAHSTSTVNAVIIRI